MDGMRDMECEVYLFNAKKPIAKAMFWTVACSIASYLSYEGGVSVPVRVIKVGWGSKWERWYHAGKIADVKTLQAECLVK
jgi:hypothetical protein